MSSLTTVDAKLPPGFRFHPRDDELICDYLMKRVMGYRQEHQYSSMLIQVDLNNCEPWDIPETACVGGKERYFYSQRDRKYASGLRRNRATISGYWKATGRDRPIFRKEILVGTRKTLVFYQGRAPNGRRTDWVMHEFRLEQQTLGPGPDIVRPAQEDWVLCRVFNKKYGSEESAIESQESRNCYEAKASASDPSLKPLIEPCNITFDQTDFDQCLEQVPCFSNFTSSQTGPASSLAAQMNSRETPSSLAGDIVPYFGGVNIADIGAYSSALLLNNPSVCDEKYSFKAVLDHYNSRLMKDSPSLGESGS